MPNDTKPELPQLNDFTKDIKDGLTGANAPSSGNVFATLADIGFGGAISAFAVGAPLPFGPINAAGEFPILTVFSIPAGTKIIIISTTHSGSGGGPSASFNFVNVGAGTYANTRWHALSGANGFTGTFFGSTAADTGSFIMERSDGIDMRVISYVAPTAVAAGSLQFKMEDTLPNGGILVATI